jgi:hypothetical protein
MAVSGGEYFCRAHVSFKEVTHKARGEEGVCP